MKPFYEGRGAQVQSTLVTSNEHSIDSLMNRFADDFVIALEDRHSGKRLLDVLGKRLDTGLRSMKPRRAMGTSVGDTLQRHRMASVTTFDFLRFRVSAIPTERQSERADRTTEQLGSPV